MMDGMLLIAARRIEQAQELASHYKDVEPIELTSGNPIFRIPACCKHHARWHDAEHQSISVAGWTCRFHIKR